MFLTSGLFWFLMGILAVLIGAGFNAFAQDKGWQLNWWKWLLSIIWYITFSLSFYAWGTLIGENEGSAGFKIWILGMFLSIILGVIIWRTLTTKPKATQELDMTES